jgi:Tfp pilus assembly protein PilF
VPRPVILALTLLLPAAGEDNPRLAFAKGLLAEAEGKESEAAEHFEAALLADPTAVPLVNRKADSLMAAGELAKAVTLYRELAAATPERLDTQLMYADFLREFGRGDGLAEKMAGEALEKALKKFPGAPSILDRLFRSSQGAGERERSVRLFESLIAEPPLSPRAMLLAESWSNVLFDSEDQSARDRLDKLFLQSFNVAPDSPLLARAASEHFRKTGRLEQAISVLQKHTAAVPSNLELRTRLGILQFAANQNDAGQATLKEVLAINERQALAHESLAKYYRLQDQPDLARPHADAVLKIRSGDASEFLALADEWLEAENPRSARILLEKAAYDYPQDPAIAAKLAIASRRDPETRDRSSRLFREAESLFPQDFTVDPVFLTESAHALIDEKRLPAAEDRLRKAIRQFPPEAKKETAAALRQLASLWESQNKNADAARSLRARADSLDP